MRSWLGFARSLARAARELHIDKSNRDAGESMIIKMVGGAGTDRIKFDFANDTDLLNQLKLSKHEFQKEVLTFEHLDACVYFYKLRKIYIVLLYDFPGDSPDSVLYMTHSKEEASKVFREQTIIGCGDAGAWEDIEVQSVQETFARHGLLEDLKVVYQLLKKIGNETEFAQIENLILSENPQLGCGYRSMLFESEPDPGMYLGGLLYLLKKRLC